MIGSNISLLRALESSQIIHSGVSPNTDGTTNTSTSIELDANASSANGAYDPAVVLITGGTGKGQARQIFEYDGTKKIAYINRDWKITPDNTSKYVILYYPGDTHVNEGVAQGGGNDYIDLNALASDQNNLYLGQMVFIVAGTGADQARMCVGYTGATKRAMIDSNWIINPDNTSVYMTMPFPGFVHGRPAVNSSDNVLMRDIIGNKNDYVGVPYSFGVQSIIAHLNTAYYHIHGASFLYPDLAVPVTLNSGVASWADPGSYTEIIPANGITKNFDLHWASLSDISAVLDGVIRLYKGTAGNEILIGAVDVVRTSNFSREQPVPVQVPQQAANERISAKFFDSTTSARSVRIKVYGHVYSGTLT